MPLARAALTLGLCAMLAAAAVPRQRKHDARRPPESPGVSASARKLLRSLSLHDKIAQLVVMPCYGESISTRSPDFHKYQHLIRDVRVGGLIVLGHVQNGSVRSAEPYAMAAFLNRMQRMAKLPLIVGADFERGASMRVNGVTQWPHNMAFAGARDLDASRLEGLSTAREARALGVHWIFAPVADVNNNPDNSIINIRSYGENPQEVSAHVGAYIEGAHSDPANPVLVTAKHFPGHGDTATDSHMDLAVVTADRTRLEQIELVPFRAAIARGVDAIMTAHLAVPALEPQQIPATVSANVLTGLLRNELGFRGLVVTDAMDMLGLARQFEPGEASVRALLAGADVLLMPKDAEEAIRGVVRAVRSGRISEKRIDQSVARILSAKTRLGLFKSKLAGLESIGEMIDTPEANEGAQAVAQRAITLVRDNQDVFPLRSSAGACLVVLTESRYGQQGRKLIEEVRRRAPQMKISVLDPAMPDSFFNQAIQDAASCSANIVAAFVTVSAYRGNVALAGGYPNLVNALIAGKAPVALISLGNPYLIRSFPTAAAYVAAYSTAPPSEAAVAKAIFGEIPFHGKLPVTVPGVAKYGDGIQLPKRGT